MKDHFVLLVDRLLTESSIEDVIKSQKDRILHDPGNSENDEEMVTDIYSHRMDLSFESLPKKLAQCRICHDEDEDLNMETPCACCGSLKYAHRKCVQRWCNEKGNTVCEICLQSFKPDYTSPPPLYQCDGIPTDFRGNWEISRTDLHNLRFSAMVSAASHDEPDFDEYRTPSSRSLICCRVVAILFMTLLVLRHTLPIIVNGTGGYTITVFTLIMLRFIGVLLPIYVIVRAFAIVQRRQQPQNLAFRRTEQSSTIAYLFTSCSYTLNSMLWISKTLNLKRRVQRLVV